MKKKLLTLLTLAVFCMTFLSGCNLFVTDLDKDFQQVVAKVGDSEYTEEITKFDVLNLYANQGSSFIQQGYSVEKILDYFYNQLVNRRILVQEAVKALLAEKKDDVGDLTIEKVLGKNDDKSVNTENMKKLLKDYDPSITDADVQNRVYNTAFNEVVKSEEDQITTIVNKLKLQDDPDYVAPSTTEATKRPTRTDTDTEMDPVKRKDKPDRVNKPDEGATEEEKKDAGYRARAYEEYASNIETSKLIRVEDETDEFYIEQYFQMMLVEKLEQALIDAHTDLIEEEIIEEKSKGETAGSVKGSVLYNALYDRYETLQKSQIQQFDADISANITKIEGLSDTTFLLYNAAKGIYGYVKHILFKFDEAQTLEMEKINSMDWTKAKKLAERQKLADKIQPKDLREADEDKGFEGPDEKVFACVSEFMTTMFEPSFGKDTTPVLDKNGQEVPGIYKATDAPGYIGFGEKSADNIVKNATPEQIIDKFIDWEFAYSGDTGTLSGTTDMLLNAAADPFLSNQKYVKEFSDAARKVINARIGYQGANNGYDMGGCYYTTVVTDFGVHLIMVTDLITPSENYNFNDDLAFRVITTEDKALSDQDKDTAMYKIWTTIKQEVVDADYNEKMQEMVDAYKDNGTDESKNHVIRYENIWKEILNYTGA